MKTNCRKWSQQPEDLASDLGQTFLYHPMVSLPRRPVGCLRVSVRPGISLGIDGPLVSMVRAEILCSSCLWLRSISGYLSERIAARVTRTGLLSLLSDAHLSTISSVWPRRESYGVLSNE